MKNKIIISLTFIVPLLIYFALLATNQNAAIEQAAEAKNNLPKIIVFSTPMCGECRKMAPVVEQAKKNYAQQVDIIKINAVDNKPETNKLVTQHKIYLVPTLIYVTKDGKIKDRIEGSMSYNEFENTIKILLAE